MIKTIDLKDKPKMPFLINFKKIPYINTCPISHIPEKVYVEVKYVPKDKLLEIVSFREYVKNMESNYIEFLAMELYEKLKKILDPIMLQVIVYLSEENERLTPWHVVVGDDL